MEPRLVFPYQPSPNRGLRRCRQSTGERLDLLAFKDCFSRGLYRSLGTHLRECVARKHARPSYSISRYLMPAGLDVETRHKRLDEAGAYLLLTGVNPAEFIGRSRLHPDNGVIGKESQHPL